MSQSWLNDEANASGVCVLNPATQQRKGARTMASIPPEILQALHEGRLASASLVEVLALNFEQLMRQTLPQLPQSSLQCMAEQQHLGITRRMQSAAAIVRQAWGAEMAWGLLYQHPSDTLRGWAAYVLAAQNELSLQEKIRRIQPLADDAHFCVREWAWLALRDDVANQLQTSLDLLQPWTQYDSSYMRRFAIEITRPRGVWCRHIPELKAHPEQAEPLLDTVMCDGHRYVQNSCANWLNDAAKSQAAWVQNYCLQWQERSSDASTQYIIRRGLRSL